MWNFVTEFARNQIKIKSSVDKAFWEENKSFLQYNAALVEKREEKHLWTSFFNHHEDDRHHPNYVPRDKTVTAAYIHKPIEKI